MPRTRARVDNYMRDGQYWRERKTPEQIADEKDAAAIEAEAAIDRIRRQPVGVRHEHPVIEHPKWTTPFQVKRRVVTRDGLELELIGETRTLGEALTIASSEQWAAIVIDSHGRQVHFNFQEPMVRA